MAIQVTQIDDKTEGFTVEFTVINKYRRTFDPRPEAREQMIYARECVQGITNKPVEQAQGVVVVPQPKIVAADENQIIDLNPPEEIDDGQPEPHE